APDVGEVGQAPRIDGAEVVRERENRVRLVVEVVADLAGAGGVGLRGRADAVGVGDGGDPEQVGARRAPVRVGEVVADAGDRADVQHATLFQHLKFWPDAA